MPVQTPLRIAMRRYADFENALGEETAAWSQATGSPEPSFASYDLHGLHRALFADGGLRDGSCDLALFSTDWLGEAIVGGLLEDLSPHLRQVPDWPDAWPPSLTSPVLDGSQCYAVPWHDGPEALLYRADLFADPINQAAWRAETGEPLEPPRTWDAFLALCRFFTHAEKRQWGTLVAAYPDGHNTLYDLTLQLWSRGGNWTAGGEPAVGHNAVHLQTPAMADSLAFYRQLVTDPSLCHPASAQTASTETGDFLLSGEAVMMVNWFGFAARADRPGSPLRGKLALAPIPSDTGRRTVSLSAFWVLGIARGSARKEEAASLLCSLMEPGQDIRLPRHGACPVRLSTWRDPGVQASYPAFTQLEALSAGARTLPRSPALPMLADLADWLTQQAITTARPMAEILAEAQPRANALRL